MILLSPVATYQLWLVSPKTGRSTYIPTNGNKIMTRFAHAHPEGMVDARSPLSDRCRFSRGPAVFRLPRPCNQFGGRGRLSGAFAAGGPRSHGHYLGWSPHSPQSRGPGVSAERRGAPYPSGAAPCLCSGAESW